MFWLVCVSLLFLAYQLFRWAVGIIRLSHIDQRPVLITGCDSGFGYNLALKCSRSGMPTFAGCLTSAGAEKLKLVALEESLDVLHVVIMDVTSQESINTAKELIHQELRGMSLWAVVNNAGIAGPVGPDDWLSPQDYLDVLDVNTIGAIRVCQTFKPQLKKSRGRIVNIASVCSRVAPQNAGPYGVSKYATEAYSDVIRKEMRTYGVSVHILNPGFFKTPLTNPSAYVAAWDRSWAKISPELRHEYGPEYCEKRKLATVRTLTMFCSQHIDEVVNSYFHALTSVWPRTRYYPGWDSKIFFRPISLVVTPLQDWLMLYFEGLLGAEDPIVNQRR